MLILILLTCAVILWNIRAGIKELNEIKTGDRIERNIIEIQGKGYEIIFGETSVRVVDSYKAKDRADRLRIIKAIQHELSAQGLSTRETTSMEGEWLFHNIAYATCGIQQAKDVDLEYEKDKRWYVVLISEILGVTGL
ncbi:MAG: hypothetical protein J6A63_00180 [Clostridia bacterium]|nr:hypothetical protein [Clostridia bacterium]